jgi:hypothetical protein
MEMRRLSRAAVLLPVFGLFAFLWSGAAAPAPETKAPAPAKAAAPAAMPGSEVPPEMAKVADEVARDVEKMRGWQFKKPVVKRLLTEKEALDLLTKDFDLEIKPDDVAAKEALLKTLGFLPAETDLKKTYVGLLASQGAAFYDSRTKLLFIVRREGALETPGMLRIIFSHELTHALDDQIVGLEKMLNHGPGQTTEDQDLVDQAMAEGSATALMTRYSVALALSGTLSLAELQAAAKVDEDRSKDFFEAPRYFTSIIGAYFCGMNFLARGKLMPMLAGPKDVGDELLAVAKDLPRSSEQLLHPEKYWDPQKRDEPVLVKDADVEKLLARPDRLVAHKDTVGELLCAILTTPKGAKMDQAKMGFAGYWTNRAATGWGGDRFFLLAKKGPGDKPVLDATVRGVWITLWDTERDRDEFMIALDAAGPAPKRAAMKWGTLGVIYFFNFDEADRKTVEAALEKSPPTLTRDGKPWTPWEL